MPGMRRREFITLLGGAAAAWPLTASAQQPAKPLVGVLGIGSPVSNAMQLVSFRNGLSEQGYAEGQNAVIESLFPLYYSHSNSNKVIVPKGISYASFDHDFWIGRVP